MGMAVVRGGEQQSKTLLRLFPQPSLGQQAKSLEGPEDTGEPRQATGWGEGCIGGADAGGGNQAIHEEEIWHVLLF